MKKRDKIIGFEILLVIVLIASIIGSVHVGLGSSDLIAGLMNRTELSNSSFGVQLDAPVLFRGLGELNYGGVYNE